MMLHALGTLPFWLSIAGIGSAAFLYLKRTDLPEKLRRAFGPVYTLLDNKYYFDRFNDWFFARWRTPAWPGIVEGRRHGGDRWCLRQRIGALVGWFATIARKLQSGLIYHYAFTMIIGVFVLLTLWFARS